MANWLDDMIRGMMSQDDRGGGLLDARVNPKLDGGGGTNPLDIAMSKLQNQGKVCPTCGGTGRVPDIEGMKGQYPGNWGGVG